MSHTFRSAEKSTLNPDFSRCAMLLNGQILIIIVLTFLKMSDFRDIAEIHASSQLSEILQSSSSPSLQSGPILGFEAETFISTQESNLWENPIEESKVADC